MALPEKIDNLPGKRGKYEKHQKRQLHVHNRRKVKRQLQKDEEPDNNYNVYKGWTT